MSFCSNLTKIPLIYSVSYFNLGGLGALFGGLNPPMPPVATGQDCLQLLSIFNRNENLVSQWQTKKWPNAFFNGQRSQNGQIFGNWPSGPIWQP